MIAETVWSTEARLWEHTCGLVIEHVVGAVRQRGNALDRAADIYLVNYDKLGWFIDTLHERDTRARPRSWRNWWRPG